LLNSKTGSWMCGSKSNMYVPASEGGGVEGGGGGGGERGVF
jgi:hypothetical protein